MTHDEAVKRAKKLSVKYLTRPININQENLKRGEQMMLDEIISELQQAFREGEKAAMSSVIEALSKEYKRV